jgi:predicted transcriptional regulator
MNIDQVLLFLKPGEEYDAAEVAEGVGIPEKEAHKALRSLWRGDILSRRKDNDRGRLVYSTKQAQLEGLH